MVSAAVTYVTTLLAATLTLGRARVVGNEALWGEGMSFFFSFAFFVLEREGDFVRGEGNGG